MGNAGLENGLESTREGYVLHPRRLERIFWVATFALWTGLTVWAVWVVVGSLRTAPPSEDHGVTLAFGVTMVVLLALFGFVAGFTSWPPTLTVTKDRVTLLGGSHRRRVERETIIGVYRGRVHSDGEKVYYLATGQDRYTRICVHHFDPSALEAAMQSLGVPLAGDFTKRVNGNAVLSHVFRDN